MRSPEHPGALSWPLLLPPRNWALGTTVTVPGQEPDEPSMVPQAQGKVPKVWTDTDSLPEISVLSSWVLPCESEPESGSLSLLAAKITAFALAGVAQG